MNKLVAGIFLFAICSMGLAQTLPSHVDWRSVGAVTPARNQGSCGSDYAFAAIAAVEGAHKIATGHLLTLSEQELIDCSGVNGNHGCNGGIAGQAMDWIVHHGIVTSADYPYTARRAHAVNTRSRRCTSPVTARFPTTRNR